MFTDNPGGALWWLRAYYFSAVFAVSALLLLSIEMALVRNNPIVKLLVVIATCCLAVLAISPWAVVGGESIGYSVRSISGDYYHLITSYVVLGLLGSLSLLVLGTKQLEKLRAKRCMVMLVAVIPLALVPIVSILLMSIGYQVNATCALSLAITAMIAVLLYTESKHRVFFFYSYLPWTREYKFKKELSSIAKIAPSLYSSGVDARMLQRRFEEILINMAIEFTDGNQKQAAELLNLPPTTVWRKLKEYQQGS